MRRSARMALRGARGLADAAAAPTGARKFDWTALTSQLTSDEAKREVAKLRKTVEDVNETLNAQAKAREA